MGGGLFGLALALPCLGWCEEKSVVKREEKPIFACIGKETVVVLVVTLTTGRPRHRFRAPKIVDMVPYFINAHLVWREIKEE